MLRLQVLHASLPVHELSLYLFTNHLLVSSDPVCAPLVMTVHEFCARPQGGAALW